MKTGAWFIFAFLSAVPLAAQSCSEYNPPLNVIGFPQQTNSQYHITGYHYYSAQAAVSCVYSDPPTDADQSCSTQLSVGIWGYQGATLVLPQAVTT